MMGALLLLGTVLPGQPAHVSNPLSPDVALQLSGDARMVGAELVLTPDETTRAGTAFLTCPITLGPDTGFLVELVVQMDGDQGTSGADGMALVIQAASTGAAAIGRLGGELGFAGVAPGVAMELDTYRNPKDPDDNHIGVVSSAKPGGHLAVRSAPVDLNDGMPHLVRIVWSGSGGGALVVQVGDEPDTSLSAQVPLDGLIGHQGYIGLAAATGARRNRHRVLSWHLELYGQTDTDDDGTLDTCDDDDDGDGVPDPEDSCPQTADPEQRDGDGDGIGDACDEHGGDGPQADPDGDGLENAEEAACGTDSQNPDSDGDTISDGDEAVLGQPVDSDADGYVDALDADSDGDGILDVQEAGDGDWRTAPVDTDGDGTPDFRQPAGDDGDPEEGSGEPEVEGGPIPGRPLHQGGGGAAEARGGVGRPAAEAGGGQHRWIDPSERPPPPPKAPESGAAGHEEPKVRDTPGPGPAGRDRPEPRAATAARPAPPPSSDRERPAAGPTQEIGSPDGSEPAADTPADGRRDDSQSEPPPSGLPFWLFGLAGLAVVGLLIGLSRRG